MAVLFQTDETWSRPLMLYNSWLWWWETCNISPLSGEATIAIYHAITAELMGGAEQNIV